MSRYSPEIYASYLAAIARNWDLEAQPKLGLLVEAWRWRVAKGAGTDIPRLAAGIGLPEDTGLHLVRELAEEGLLVIRPDGLDITRQGRDLAVRLLDDLIAKLQDDLCVLLTNYGRPWLTDHEGNR